MKLTKHETIIYTSKVLVGILSAVIACIFFNILASNETDVCFVTGFIFIMGIVFLTVTFLILAIPKEAYSWRITGNILARCGLFSYITLWKIIKSGDYLSFSNIKYTGRDDEPIICDSVIWTVKYKGKYHIKITLDNGQEYTCLPYEFSERVAKMMNSHNTILMNGKRIYSNLDNIMPKVKWITY